MGTAGAWTLDGETEARHPLSSNLSPGRHASRCGATLYTDLHTRDAEIGVESILTRCAVGCREPCEPAWTGNLRTETQTGPGEGKAFYIHFNIDSVPPRTVHHVTRNQTQTRGKVRIIDIYN